MFLDGFSLLQAQNGTKITPRGKDFEFVPNSVPRQRPSWYDMEKGEIRVMKAVLTKLVARNPYLMAYFIARTQLQSPHESLDQTKLYLLRTSIYLLTYSCKSCRETWALGMLFWSNLHTPSHRQLKDSHRKAASLGNRRHGEPETIHSRRSWGDSLADLATCRSVG